MDPALTETIDDLELEIRRLPGVIAVGFDDEQPHLVVGLFLMPDADTELIRQRVELLALVHDPEPRIVTQDAGTAVPTIDLG